MLRPPVVKPITPATGPAWMRSRYSVWALAGISFAESVFAPILIDPFLIGLILAERTRWKLYVVTAIVASLIGGIFAYSIGLLFFDTFGQAVIAAYEAEEKFAAISADVNENGFVFVLIGAFTPIPYKLVAIASGILQVSLLTFVIASMFGRILRLGLVGFAAYSLSPKMLPIMQRNHYMVALIMGGVLISYIGLKLFV